MKKKIINTLGLVVLATAILLVGNASRSYSAFGGEDMGAIILISIIIHMFLPSKHEDV